MAFFMDVSDLLDEFGTDIKVWPAPDKPIQSYPGGPTTSIDLSDTNCQERHEPVVPLNTHSSIGAALEAGGVQLQGKLVWYSKDRFLPGTIVDVPAQFGRFKLTDHGEYNPYAKFWEYVLKGDSQNGLDD